MKNVSIESSGGKKFCLWVEENCEFTEIFLRIMKLIRAKLIVMLLREIMVIQCTDRAKHVLVAGATNFASRWIC
jgi:hypothetical protein